MPGSGVWTSGSKPMQQKHMTIALLIAVFMGLLFATPAFGASIQQHSIQAFRLLNNIGLIEVLPAKDSELAALDRFELANLVAGAAERLLGMNRGPEALPLPALAKMYASSVRTGAPAEQIVESLIWLEQCYSQELRLLDKGPYFVAVTRDALTGYAQPQNSGDDGSPNGDPHIYVAPSKTDEYRLIAPNASPKGRSDLPVIF